LNRTIAAALVVTGLSLLVQPATAQDFANANTFANSSATSGTEAKPSFARRVVSEVVIMRYRAALKLTAAQAKYWPAAAAALRGLARQAQVDEAAVRRYAPSIKPLIASLDDQQKQVAMGLAQQAGLAQYASLF
jgi:hypothetical protein